MPGSSIEVRFSSAIVYDQCTILLRAQRPRCKVGSITNDKEALDPSLPLEDRVEDKVLDDVDL